MKELRMLCAEDEQSRSCWMTAFRIFKVILHCLHHSTANMTSSILLILCNASNLMAFIHYCSFSFAVWDRIVPELQDSSTKENFTFTLFSSCGKFTGVIVHVRIQSDLVQVNDLPSYVVCLHSCILTVTCLCLPLEERIRELPRGNGFLREDRQSD